MTRIIRAVGPSISLLQITHFFRVLILACIQECENLSLKYVLLCTIDEAELEDVINSWTDSEYAELFMGVPNDKSI